MMTIFVLTSSEECDFKDYSYTLCLENEDCSTAFYIEEDSEFTKERFHYLLSSEYTNNNDQLAYLLELNLCNDTNVADLWVQMMSKSKFCKANMYYEPGLGCVCTNGKICTEDPGEVQLFRTKAFTVLIIVVSVIVLYIYYHFSIELKKCEKILAQKESSCK